eukprot:TRINITY_DN4425_c0_g3_i2.p2 TRINITY_DN4425_c0_g3~~TRINITY_DN4425_c0_g3_i2.p2  ORF type:complete len:123 (+),score=27.58 TRINITY_DN4425_c0_g3_i2:457-825(+)
MEGVLHEGGIMTGAVRDRVWRIRGREMVTDAGPRGRPAVVIDLPTARLTHSIGDHSFTLRPSREAGAVEHEFRCDFTPETDAWVQAVREVQMRHGMSHAPPPRRPLHVVALPLQAATEGPSR